MTAAATRFLLVEKSRGAACSRLLRRMRGPKISVLERGMNQGSLALGALSDEVLLARLVDVLSRGRRVEAEIIAHIAEVDARRLYLGQACSSMHVYVTERLHLSDAEAYLRITVARLSRRFPVVLAMLADGRAHLSGLVRLAPHLSDENADEILGRASFRSKREIELLVAELAPRPDAPPRIRRLPAAQTRPTAGAAALPTAGAAAPPTAGSVEPNAGPPVDAHDLVPDRAETPTTLSSGVASPGAASPALLSHRPPGGANRRCRRWLRCLPVASGSSSPPAPSFTARSSGLRRCSGARSPMAIWRRCSTGP
ncbi:MAG TPA: hypothetical protein VK698_06025 [Kofleriaceae bacterium]|nr:hypothetical protein [Kofleriaceae bacterium]